MVNKLFIFYLFKTQIKIQIKTQIKKKIKKTQTKKKTQIRKKINKYKKEFIIVKIVDVNYKTQLY